MDQKRAPASAKKSTSKPAAARPPAKTVRPAVVPARGRGRQSVDKLADHKAAARTQPTESTCADNACGVICPPDGPLRELVLGYFTPGERLLVSHLVPDILPAWPPMSLDECAADLASVGWVDGIEFIMTLLDADDKISGDEIMEAAAGAGRSDVVGWFLAQIGTARMRFSEDLFQRGFNAAARANRVDMMHHLLEMMRIHANLGLRSVDCSVSPGAAFIQAARSGALDAMVDLEKSFIVPGDDWEFALVEAARWGNISIVQFMLETGKIYDVFEQAFVYAANGGYLRILEMFKAWNDAQGRNYIDIGTKENALINAAGNDHIDVVRWLLEHMPECATHTDDALIAASSDGADTVLTFLMQRCSEDEHLKTAALAMRMAARHGHTRTMRLLYGMIPPITDDFTGMDLSDAFGEAAEGGSVEALELLRTWDAEAFGKEDLESALRHAAGYGEIRAMHYLKKLGATNFDDALTTAAECGQEGAMRLLREWGATKFATALRDCYNHQGTPALLVRWLVEREE